MDIKLLKCKNKEYIIEYLKKEDEIANLNIIGALQNINKTIFNNSEDDLEIYVDQLNSPNWIIVKEYSYWHYIYVKNYDYVHYLKKEYFDKLSEYGVDACDEKVYEILSNDRKLDWIENCILLYVDDEVNYINKIQIESGMISDAKEINDYYTFKDECSLEFIKDNLKNRPSSVYRINGILIAWVLLHRDDSIGIMYTKKEYRGQNIAYELSMNVLKKVIKSGRIPFIHVAKENEHSLLLAKKCGFKIKKLVIWFGINNRK